MEMGYLIYVTTGGSGLEGDLRVAVLVDVWNKPSLVLK